MKMSQLKAIVKRGESEFLEFKKSTAQLQTAMQTMSAFLNSEVGGTVLIGVTDDGKIIGQEVTDSTKKEIASELKKIEPHADVNVEFISVNDKRCVIMFSAKEGSNAPYVYDGRPYIRSQSTTQKMSQEKYIIMLHNRSQLSVAWDKLTTNDCIVKDLDTKRINQVVDIAVSEKRLPREALRANIDEILKKFELLVGNKLTNAAVVLFCKNEHKQFMQSNIKLARFKGTTKSEFLDEKSLRSNIFDLYDQAMIFLGNYLPVGAHIEAGNPFRVTTPAIPHQVLREAVINALCHRDYSLEGGSIAIAIYDDRVEITSSGRLPSSIKLKDLTKKHESFPRNRLIANVLYACHMIEKWGRGTQEMVELCQKSGNPIPHFEEMTGCLWITLPLREPIPRAVLTKAPSIQLTDRQKEIIAILKQGTLSREQIMSKLTKSIETRTMQRELARLRELELIDSEGAGKFMLWALIKK
ncbi:MAG: ATP-binding protein [bacterium]